MRVARRQVGAVLLLAAGLGGASAAVAQQARDTSADGAALGLRPTSAPAAQRPSYRGSYTVVGKPVRPSKSTRVTPGRGVADVPPLGDRQVGPLAPGTPTPAVKAGPGLPPVVAPARRRPRLEGAEAFDPLGVRVGSITLRPSIEASTGYDTNPNRIPNPASGSPVLRTDIGLLADSDWERHAMNFVLRGAYWRYFETPAADRPEVDGAWRLRLDALRDTTVDLEAIGRLTTQQPGIEQPFVGASRGRVLEGGVGAGVTQRFGDASLGLKGAIGRQVYEPIPLGNGVSLSQSERDLNTFGLTLRAGYEVSPGIKPFMEVTGDRRIYDQAIDAGGYRRSSSGQAVRAGTTLELSRLIVGEASIGYGQREYDDPRLEPINGFLANASLVWTPTALTTVRFRAGTELSETTVSGASGAVVHSAGVEVTHALRRYLSLSALLDGSQTVYQGVPITEDRYTAALRLDWKLNRSVVVRASVAHEQLDSSAVGADYTANVYLVGLRLQR